MITKTDELKSRVKARQAELSAQLERAKAEGKEKTSAAVESLEKKLNELSNTMKEGWENLSDDTVTRLNEWLKKT